MDILELNQKISEEIRAIVSMFGNISVSEFNVKVDNYLNKNNITIGIIIVTILFAFVGGLAFGYKLKDDGTDLVESYKGFYSIESLA